MKAIVRKEVHLTMPNIKALKRMAKPLNISLKEYMERILERHVIQHVAPEKKFDYPLTIDEFTK